MKKDFRREGWEDRLRPFPQVWDRVQGKGPGRPLPPPPPPPMFGPAPPPPMFGPPPPPGPPIMPGRGCCSKAVRFHPWKRGRD